LFLNYFLDNLLLFLEKCWLQGANKLKWTWSVVIFRRKGVIMKIMAVIVVAALVLPGCARFQRSEAIDTDKLGGYASGTYSDRSSGHTGKVTIGGSAYGAGGAGAGFGAGWICGETGPPKSGSYDFARAIAMINYSKKLKSIKYDEIGGVIDYEFETMPVSSLKTAQPGPGAKPKLPPSFGHQPVE
jgi:hypothetical protein